MNVCSHQTIPRAVYEQLAFAMLPTPHRASGMLSILGHILDGATVLVKRATLRRYCKDLDRVWSSKEA